MGARLEVDGIVVAGIDHEQTKPGSPVIVDKIEVSLNAGPAGVFITAMDDFGADIGSVELVVANGSLLINITRRDEDEPKVYELAHLRDLRLPAQESANA